MKTKTCLSIRKGSILAYSLIILATMLVIAVGISTVSIMEKKNAGKTDASVQALQTADSGAQLLIKAFDDASDKTQQIASILPTSFSCSAGSISGDSGVSGTGTIVMTLYTDEAGATPVTNCGEQIQNIKSIKSVGTYNDTVRAVQVAVAASGDYQLFCWPAGVSMCCRINTSTGTTECKYTSNPTTGTWTSATNDPW